VFLKSSPKASRLWSLPRLFIHEPRGTATLLTQLISPSPRVFGAKEGAGFESTTVYPQQPTCAQVAPPAPGHCPLIDGAVNTTPRCPSGTPAVETATNGTAEASVKRIKSLLERQTVCSPLQLARMGGHKQMVSQRT
jgi:hypothetical protein